MPLALVGLSILGEEHAYPVLEPVLNLALVAATPILNDIPVVRALHGLLLDTLEEEIEVLRHELRRHVDFVALRGAQSVILFLLLRAKLVDCSGLNRLLLDFV